MRLLIKTNVGGDILATARRLGINVMYASDLERYVEKYMNKKRSLEGGANANNRNDNNDLANNENSLHDTSLTNSAFKKDADHLPQSLIRKSYSTSGSNHKCI